MRFEFAKSVSADESRDLEFKAVSSKNPVRAVADNADKYAVAFLNSRGGKILWGIRDGDKVVEGVRLTAAQRDELRRAVTDRLNGIEPKIDPTRFTFELYPVKNGSPELFVISLTVPRINRTEPFFAAGRDAYVRLDGAIRHLTGPELTAWITQRTRAPRRPFAEDAPTQAEIYHNGDKLPFDREILFDLRGWDSNERAKVILDFHLPSSAGARQKQTFGIVASSFIIEIPDWSSERVGPITLPDGRHLFTSDMMALNLLPGGWHRYKFTLIFREHVVDRREEFAIRIFSESGPTDIPFALRMLGIKPTVRIGSDSFP